MSNSAINTLNFFEKLKNAGMPEDQAKVQVEVITEVVEANKRDLYAVETRLEAKIDKVETRLEARIDKVETRLDKLTDKVELLATKVATIAGEMAFVKWMLGLLTAGITTLVIKAFV